MIHDIDAATHSEPAWRHKANFIVHADLANDFEAGKWEQLWVRELDDARFEVCCIPFFVYDLALGDVLETKAQGDMKYVFHRVVEPSGHYTFRAFFAAGASEATKGEVCNTLETFECPMEWYGAQRRLLSVDAANDDLAQKVANLLLQWEQLGHLKYETGRTE